MADAPFLSDDVGEMEAQRRAAFEQSGFGWVDSKLKGASDWIKGWAQRRQPKTEVGQLPFSSVSPVELIPMMATEGGRTINRWLYGTKDPGMLRPEDTLAPTGAGAMAAPFVAAKHGVSLGTSGGKLAAQAVAPFQRQVDDLGYYSKLDEVLGGLKPTDTVTMDTLAKRGVKAAEIEARGLSPFVADGKGAKVSDLQKSAQPVQLRESTYGGPPPAYWDQLSQAQYGKPYSDLSERARLDIRRQSNDPDEAFKDPKWRDYATDGNNPTYHEGVLHLPDQKLESVQARREAIREQQNAMERAGQHRSPEYQALSDEDTKLRSELHGMAPFRSGHWDEPNAIAHYRASMQPMEGGGNAYLIDELQSDWGQKLRDGGVRDEAKIAELRRQIQEIDAESVSRVGPAREILTKAGVEREPGEWASMPPDLAMDLLGYVRNRVPEAQPLYDQMLEAFERRKLLDAELRTAAAATPGNPFVNTSEQWMTTALRRLMRNAADQDAQGIAITPGAIHNERFGLEKQISELEYNPQNKILIARTHDGRRGIQEEGVTPEKLEQMVGKEAAQKLLAQQATPGDFWGATPTHRLTGQDLRMGGEGMKYAYDKMVPKLLQKELQKLDPSIKYGQQNLLPYDTEAHLPISESPFHYFPLTDQARAKIKEGLPLFNAPGGPEAAIQAAIAQQQLQGPFQEE